MRRSAKSALIGKWRIIEMDPSPEMDGPNSTMMVRSTAKSASISPTNQPSKLANGDFFSSLLDHARGQHRQSNPVL